jgi:hypothetical protein
VAGQPTMREEGYTFVRFEGHGSALFRHSGGSIERWAANKGHASAGFRWRGTDWEFCGTVSPPA